jgi:hypothetical protein
MFEILLIIGALYNYRAPLADKVDPRCYEHDYVHVWIYFTDKGINVDEYTDALSLVRLNLKEAALKRRLNRGAVVVDYADIPLSPSYIDELEAHGAVFIQESKWLNAASFYIFKEDIEKLATMDFVYKITPVASYAGPSDAEISRIDSTLFGLTYRQIHMFMVDSLHSRGYFGSNIKIGILDTGLRRRHAALENVRVIAEHDFMDGDQMFADNVPINEQQGVYSSIAYCMTPGRLSVIYDCDTQGIYNLRPSREIMYLSSTDNGYTWHEPVKLTEEYRNWAHNLDVCGSETLFITYNDKYGLQSFRYAPASDSGLKISLDGDTCKDPSAVYTGDSLHVAYHGKHKVYLKSGTFSGFNPKATIDSSTMNVKAPKIVLGLSELGVFYHVEPDDSLIFIKSTMPVNTFTRSFIAFGKNADACVSGDTIFAVWKDRSDKPSSRVAFARSYDFGDSFESPVYLSEECSFIGKISIARLNNNIKVAWEADGQIYYRNSYDNGNGFTAQDSINKEFSYLPTLGASADDIILFYCERGDSITDGYILGDPEYTYPRHGTEMLGLIGGYSPNTYVGVAPAADFYIAKTEIPGDSLYEFPVEEDTWIAGMEWCEAQGVDIVNSSLGYTAWYSWPDDFDGNTSPASIAATEASDRGMIICNASGNISASLPPRIHIPGDAEGALTVGGIDTLFNRWENSGYYPTQDHVLKKPEIVCLANAPIVVEPDSVNSYLYSRGTSGATAITAGICALLLEGHPRWSADSVKLALYNTASYANSPTDSMGYGWPNAFAAMYWPDTMETDGHAGTKFLTPYPNPFIIEEHGAVHIPFQLEQAFSVELRVYSLSGRLIKTENRGSLLPGRYDNPDPQTSNPLFSWDGMDSNGELVSSGIYYCLLITHGGGTDVVKIAVIR